MSFDFAAAVTAPFRMQPGLRRLAPGALHFTPLRPGSPAQREKLAVLSAFASEALLKEASFDATPALAAVCAQAALEHPDQLQWDGMCASSPALGVAVRGDEVRPLRTGVFGLGDEMGRCLSGLPPQWRLTGLLALAFLEDLAVVDGVSTRVPWMSVALPSHWAPEDKIGRPFHQIHAPVADNGLLMAAADRLMALVSAGERWERFVWNVSAHPRRHAHPRRVDPHRWPEAEATDFDTQAWWRTERQTFIPLRGTDDRAQAVFTIAVEVQPLKRAITSAWQAAALSESLASMSPAVLSYRGLTDIREPLLDWLASLERTLGSAQGDALRSAGLAQEGGGSSPAGTNTGHTP